MSGYGEPFDGALTEEQIGRLQTLLEISRGLVDVADPLVQAHALGVASATQAVLVHLRQCDP
jgi:hypothetical protein